ncbi:alpha/beta fold hydrolase [Tundrisphaera lichenicola]|uniref:alpha/beta fold hydrolase n=1 Tax=Tundrisphaera lichenicola TaxID=2029860 RepID=UPI003EB6955B
MSQALDTFRKAHPGRDFDRDGLRLHYLDEGEGEPVVMVHGNPSWSFYYRNLVEALNGSHRTIVPDHIGCGYSDKPDDSRYDYTLKSRVDDLEALLDHLGVDRGITLVVHDWGGMIGMAYAARHPERIARLVILNTGAFPLPKSKPFPWPLWICRNTRVGAWMVRGGNAFAGIASRVCCKRNPMPKDLREAYVAPYDSWANRIATLRFVQDIPLSPNDQGYDIVAGTADRLGEFAETPMMIAWGLKDFVFDRHFLDEWTRRFPEAEVHRFEDCGHYILEDAGDQIIPLIRAFLAANPVLREVG